ncbi:MAG: transketolase, partial [Thermoanaerobaculales bacterium]|nr:transketolase [Thermoanaerobaculales bacterium]
EGAAEGVARGAWVVSDVEEPQIVLAATGSEVTLAQQAQNALKGRGVRARIVSMPSWELFEDQSEGYKRSILPPDVAVVGIEAGVTLGWRRWVGNRGAIIGLDRFGASAPGSTVARELGFTVEAVVEKVLGLLGD